jgi:predicted  nucleic acid-binding Zn-ribbon protein
MPSRKLRKDMPGYTCPDIDRTIHLLEELRKSNDELRAAAETACNEWDAAAEDAETEYERAEKAEAEAASLADRVSELEDDLNNASIRIAELEEALLQEIERGRQDA